MARSLCDVLRKAEETLETAELGLRLIETGTPREQLAGFRNVVIFGRAVTNVLQNLRGHHEGFEAWYGPYRLEMENDPLMKYLYNHRTEILKKGSLNRVVSVHITHLRIPDDLERFPKPPGAKGFFIGDQYGGSGWIVELADGTQESYYVELPPENVTVSIHLSDAPVSRLAGSPEDRTPLSVARFYLTYLRRMVEDAKRTFG